MNNKGFTLIELLAVIILLALIMAVTSVSVVGIINNSKQKSYELLIEDIKNAAKSYFEECENRGIINTNISCPSGPSEAGSGYQESTSENFIWKRFSINDLLLYGYLTSTSTATEKDASGNEIKKIEDPRNNNSIGACRIEIVKFIHKTTLKVRYEIGKIGEDDACPTDDNYTGVFD